MRTESGTRTANRLRTPLIVLVAVALLGSVTVGVRQVTVQLRADDGGRSSTALVGAAESGGSTDSSQGTAGDRSAVAEQADAGELPIGAAGSVPAEVSVGPVVADEEFKFTPPPDRVAVTAGADAAAAVSQLPDTQAPLAGSATGETDSGIDSGQVGVGEQLGSLERAPEPFAMLVSAEVDGYLAMVRVAFGGALEGGLASLIIDFGDGSNPFETDGGQITAIGNGGLVTVTHAYEPTLTLQPRTATAVATDGAGQTHVRTLRFETRAEFRLSYSPLTVTALSDCDIFGKGDFELTWQNDSSLPPGKTSTFKLGKDESYVERDFPTSVAPVHYGEFPELFLVGGKPAFFYLQLLEKDNIGSALLDFLLAFPYEFRGPQGLPPFLRQGPVAQLGNHQYGVTLLPFPKGGEECYARVEFTVALTML